MAYLLGLITLRTGISRSLPPFGDLNTQPSPYMVGESLQARLSYLAVVMPQTSSRVDGEARIIER